MIKIYLIYKAKRYIRIETIGCRDCDADTDEDLCSYITDKILCRNSIWKKVHNKRKETK